MKIDYCGFMIDGTPEEVFYFVQLADRRKEGEPAAVPDPEEQPKQEPAPKRKPNNYRELDVGKMRALRDAGWTMAKIADEMRCAPQTVANKLKEA